MSRFAIDLGHGVAYDTGAVSSLIKEETIIDEVGNLVINKLVALGHSVVEVRPWAASSVGNSLLQRTTKANNNNVDYYVSIHANAGGGIGTEVFTYGGREVSVARKILDNIVALGFRNRGIKDGSRLAVIRNTNATALLIEVCFIDTKSDVDLYRKIGAESIANAIVKGLTGNTVNITNTAPTTSQNNVQSNNGAPTIAELQMELNRQFNAGLAVDNIKGPKTLGACVNVSYGARGNLTKWIQRKLNYLGYNSGEADGIFGDKTLAAVKDFQNKNGLAVDGIVGRNTWNKLI